MGPLQGIRVIDLTAVLMGPSASQAMGDMGATIIKVEAPEGDIVRQILPAKNPGMGAIYLNANRNKRSICLDLKQASGLAALKRMVADADVLFYNMRPAAMERLGLGYETIAAINPAIIYAGVFGFGQDGPYAARPAYDDLIQGASVMSHLFARAGDGTPRYVPSAIADRVVGITAMGHVCAALVHRERTGEGQRVDIPMFETMTSVVLGDHLGGYTFDPQHGEGGYPRQLSPYRRPYRTQDGYVCALVYNDKQWTSFLAAIGQSDLPERDPRFANYASRAAHIDFVYAELEKMFLDRTTAQWMDLLARADVPAMPMHDFESIQEDPHLKAVGFFREVEHETEGRLRLMDMPTRWSRTPVEFTHLPPRQGEQGREILGEFGFSGAEIAALERDHALILPPPANDASNAA
ncbi:CaiB/BaiF family protein [Caenibius tardaugens NBRC 16725]|uniref:CaiB/BaiF family protein n=1 Tax=Caenibius tardaugens NBRC 16725 TaxID=1219035 RepID=U2YMS0_9SPHN|nr:CoA transferase [Caenibius tardaugens]AZI35643.1 CoA transferase [Caenibius tardaugens NBRC 16725]GAD50070.1 CaiB/BaiF family protein [Caenibius tardaugens NBRC 16725]